MKDFPMSLSPEYIYRLYKGNNPFDGENCFADFLNQSLRDRKTLVDPWLSASEQLDSMIVNEITDTRLTLYRATTDDFVSPYISGRELIYPAYMSTSMTREGLYRHFATAHRGMTAALLEIECPVGLPALNMEKNDAFGGYEQERLLPRNAKFKVISEKKTNDPDQIAAVTSITYSKAYTSLKTYSLMYVA